MADTSSGVTPDQMRTYVADALRRYHHEFHCTQDTHAEEIADAENRDGQDEHAGHDTEDLTTFDGEARYCRTCNVVYGEAEEGDAD